MNTDCLAGGRPTIGFRSMATIDESPAALGKIRAAVARAKEGDLEAVGFIYASYSHNVYGYVRSIVDCPQDAEDVTQQVFTKMICALAKYDEQGVPFVAWLLRLARNAAIDHVRGANRLTPMETVVDPSLRCGGDLERSHSIMAALESLTRDQREVVILRHVVGFSPDEIATRMGRTTGSIHGLHHRGRRALQRELEQRGSMPFTFIRREREFATA